MPRRDTTAPKKTGKSIEDGRAPTLGTRVMLSSPRPGFSRMQCRPNQIVFRQGDRADAVFYIDKGKIRRTVVSEEGRERVIAILDDGDFFGEPCLEGQPRRKASAIAITETSLVRIEKEAMVRMIQDQHAFSEMFIGFLLSRNAQIEDELIDHLFNSSEKRLARLLLLLAHSGRDGKLEPITPKISQEILAERVGTTRSRINFFMNKFRKKGLIEYDGTLLRVHSSLLSVIVHD